MCEEHIPIDSKDDSAEYRAQVWEAVRQRIGSDLTPLKADATFGGIWEVELDMFGTRQPMFGADEVGGEGRIVVSGETYHAATTESGELVLFNGDQSLVMVAKKR